MEVPSRLMTHEDFKREHLDRIDNDLMQTKLVLVDITEPRRLCLQELGLRKNFVIWVKEALEDINELKVFVDLASISAGENDLDVDRVACFHDAVLGYSPMLYELKPDSGFQAFKEVLKKLWRALDNDNNLPKKLLSLDTGPESCRSRGARRRPEIAPLLLEDLRECRTNSCSCLGRRQASVRFCQSSRRLAVAFIALFTAGNL
ncbi:E3 ubiquitin-protein ligase rnf213-alpha-like, partial [Salvelinus sp. IW2-2015]|uniref:E3 ubiquitin-protein ligase rnf213-alpha-like n=1 Tax=Salvelinus sp. IW2-2015 TaxID=2691554 RepID=UPI0038D4686A